MSTRDDNRPGTGGAGQGPRDGHDHSTGDSTGDSTGEGADDLSALARRYLDLWQDQISRAASDPALAEAMGRTFQALTSGAGAFAEAARRGFEAGQGATAGSSAHADADAAPDAASRSAPAAPAPEHGGDGVAQLAARLRRLEERVAALEAARDAGPAQPAGGGD
ncbi:hypothetical protein [Roseospirillum parvum]|uniref:Uncharacterized protein n=1 Tax=Roseospirillum parvum TaxID=83401 RepID=A0A1G7ZL93_9PROT|nr:hypothetical protein [Roseospirillum parvum]SDH09473.1 hypothetical protein SAMN05421742_104144 [Roseospirillum parvum]